LDDAAATQFEDALRRNGRLVSADTMMRRVDGQPIHVICHASAAANGHGELREITGLIFDVTAQRLREDQRWRSERIETVGRLAGGVAHDFNNLLAIIQGYADLLAGQVVGNEPAKESVQQIQQAAERAATLTRQLLAFGRRQVLQPTDLQLSEMIGAMLPQLQNLVGDRVELLTDLAPDLGFVRVDRAQFEQALVHLAANGREALPSGGRLTLTTRNIELRHSPGAGDPLLPSGEYVELCIGDNGPGMSDEAKAHLFEPFFTTKEPGKGAGLGLPMVYGIVKQSGGDIQVHSVTGEGTRVQIVLPRVQPRSVVPVPLRKTVPRNGVTILLVDDEVAVRQLVKQVLAREGYRVIDAPNGVEALAVIEQTGLIPDLLLTDVVMPGLSGRELWERLRVRQPDLPVLYLSGYTADAVIRNGVLSQQMNFLQKPFRPEALVEKVVAVLTAR
jgi:signal transduction histidine kinase/CheY-like chemotaxis protein